MRKVMLLAFVLALVLATTSCGNNDEKPISTQLGNTAGNVANYGDVTEDDNYCYYQEYRDNVYTLYRASKDFKEKEKILDVKKGFNELNAHGNYIYYIDGFPGFLQRMSLDGKKSHKLITFRMVSNVVISGEKLYYRLSGFNDDAGKVYCCDLNGRKKKLLAKEVTDFFVDGDTIYYTNTADEEFLWAMDISGENKRRILKRKVLQFILDEKYIYYIEREETLRLFRLNKETLQEECINEERCNSINLLGDWIYYATREKDGKIYRMTKDGSKKEIVLDINAAEINIAGNSVFFREAKEDFGWYRLDLTTNSLEKLSD